MNTVGECCRYISRGYGAPMQLKTIDTAKSTSNFLSYVQMENVDFSALGVVVFIGVLRSMSQDIAFLKIAILW